MALYFYTNALRQKFEELAENSLLDIAKMMVELEEEKEALETRVTELEEEVGDLSRQIEEAA